MPTAVTLTVLAPLTWTDAESNVWNGFAHLNRGDGTYDLTIFDTGRVFWVVRASPGASAGTATGGEVWFP